MALSLIQKWSEFNQKLVLTGHISGNFDPILKKLVLLGSGNQDL